MSSLSRVFPVRPSHLAWLAIALAPAAGADTRRWPSAICPSTLQACLNGALDGDRIEIDTPTPVDENITLVGRSLTLTSAGARRAQFARGRSLDVEGASGTSPTVEVSRLRFLDGHVRLSHSGAGVAAFSARDLDIERSPGGASAYLLVSAGSGATVNATVTGNRVVGRPDHLNDGLLRLEAGGATLNAYAAWNRIARNADAGSDGAGILVDVHGFGDQPAAGYVRVFGNDIRGTYDRAGILFSEGLFASTPASFQALAFNNVIVGDGPSGTGIGFVVNTGTIHAQAINNTVTAVRAGISALHWNTGSSAARIDGLVWNNLIQAGARGLEFAAELTPDLTNDYNLINAAANLAPLGAHTLTTDTRLVATAAPRLRTGSPAIDAAHAATLGNALVDAGLPTLDGDGLRRVKGAGADIGAYESGDLSTLHVSGSGNLAGNWTSIDHPATNGRPDAQILATRIYGPGGPRSLEPFGVFFTGAARWALYNESMATMGGNLHWSVLVPATGAGRFVHQGTGANTTGWHTQIDNGATNGQAERIVLVTHNWSTTPSYNAHLIGIYYAGSGSAGRWHVANLDRADLPSTSAFNVYAQPASPNALRVTAVAGSQRLELDHPLINGVACATVHATRVVSPASPGPVSSFDLDFNPSQGRWAIYSPTAWPADTAFNVLIDPAQVFDCTDRIFADDLE